MDSSTDPGRPLVLITRPQEDAADLIAGLRNLGCNSLVEPMLRIEPIAEAEVNLADCRAMLITSANGVRALAQKTARRDLPVYTVGAASAAAARLEGFTDVTAAEGNVERLAALIKESLPPGPEPLFHAAGSVTAGDLKADLEEAGYTVRRIPLYRAVPTQSLSAACKAALDANRIAAVSFFSPRTAETFVKLLQEEKRTPCSRTVQALCLSEAVTAKLTPLDWAGIAHCETAETASLLSLTARVLALGTDTAPDGPADPAQRNDQMAENEKPEEAETDTIPSTTPEGTIPEEGDTPEEGVSTEMTIDADAVIEAFGGIRPMAAKLEVAVSTVQGWKARSHIPDNRWRDIIAAAESHGVDLSATLTAPSSEDRGDEPPPEAAPPSDIPAVEPAEQEIETEAEAEKPQQQAASPVVSAPPAAKQGGGLALVVGLVALAAAVTRPAWAPHVDPYLAKYMPMPQSAAPATPPAPDLSPQLEALSTRLAAVEARPVALPEGTDIATLPADLAAKLSALETALAQAQAEIATVQKAGEDAKSALDKTRTDLQAAAEQDEASRNRLVERMGVLESMVDTISQEAERATGSLAGIESRLADQDQEIAALKSRPALEGATQAGLALAVGDVESALAGGRPFAAALSRIEGLAVPGGPVQAALEGLRPYAESGVATRAQLMADYDRDAPVIQAELGQSDGDLVETLIASTKSLISIRRKGDSPDAPPVSQAEAALARGDLASAVAALSPVAAGSETLQAWLSKAEARLKAEAGLSALRDAAAQGLIPSATGNTAGTGDKS